MGAGEQALASLRVERLFGSTDEGAGGARRYDLGRALHERPQAALGVARDDGHALAGGREPDRADALEASGVDLSLAREREERAFRRRAVNVPALVVGFEPRVVADGGDLEQPPESRVFPRRHGLAALEKLPGGLVARARDVEVAAGEDDARHAHDVLGERARLVRADDGSAAERLDRREPSHEAVGLRHPPDAGRQRDRRDGRQAFGDRRDREDDARFEHEPEGPVAQEPENRHEGREPDGQEREPPAELFGLLLERRLLAVLAGDELSDAADLRVSPCAGHDHAPPSAHDCRAGVGHRGPVGQRRGGVDRVRRLRDGDALAGERGLVGLQVAHGGDPSIRGHDLAARQDEEIAGPEVVRGDLPLEASAHDARRRGGKRPERIEGALGTEVGDEPEDDREDHGCRDRERVSDVAQRQHDGGRGDQDEDHAALELVPENAPGAARVGVGGVVGWPLGQGVRRQAGLEIRPKLPGDVLDLPRVPGGGRRRARRRIRFGLAHGPRRSVLRRPHVVPDDASASSTRPGRVRA